MNIENSNEFQDSYGQKKIWCKTCKRRTKHEYDKGEAENKWQPLLPAGWFCLDCGELNAS